MKINIHLWFLFLCLGTGPIAVQAQRQSGIVFEDTNGNGTYDREEPPLSNICISNGREVVQTDRLGKYRIPLREGNPVFLIKPSGYSVQLTPDNVPMISRELYGDDSSKKNGTKKAFDFPLYPHQEDAPYKVALLGDTQVKIMDDVFYVAKLVGEQLIDEKVDFVVPLGDLVFDNLALMGPLKQVLGKIGAPIYYVYGNHDRDYDAMEVPLRDQTYTSHFGPSYYAFNYGKDSFIVLNTVFPESGTKKYEGKIDAEQLQFIENYLKVLPAETKIHLMMHIPLEKLSNLSALLQLFKGHPHVSAYAGHTHTQYFKNFDGSHDWPHAKELTELVAGAVCGTWWRGEKDVFGIPSAMMRDGTPKGYWIMEMEDGNKKLNYQVSGNVPNRQMHIWTPHPFVKEKVFFLNKEILANVYAGSGTTKVDVRIEGRDWQPMQKVLEADPYYRRLLQLQESGTTPTDNGLGLGKALLESQHLWKIQIPESLEPGVYTVQVKATDIFGLDTKMYDLLFIN